MASQNPNQFTVPGDRFRSNQVQPETAKNDTQSVSTQPPTYPSGIPPSQQQNTWSPNQQYYPPNQQHYPPNQQYYPPNQQRYPPNQQYYPQNNEQIVSKQNPSPAISTTLLVFGILGAVILFSLLIFRYFTAL